MAATFLGIKYHVKLYLPHAQVLPVTAWELHGLEALPE